MLGPDPLPRATVDGKFISVDGERFLVKGVTYGTFAPDAEGHQFPTAEVIGRDFTRMRASGVNTVRTYTTPEPHLLDQAAQHGLRVMVGMPWSQHVAFLDDPGLCRQIRRAVVTRLRELASHPATLLFALGNEIPAPIVRWHGPARVQQFLHVLYEEAKAAAPDALVTYVNYPPTEYLSLPFFDVCAFNVYLHHEPDLRRYLARLQHLAGHKPLLLAEAGADSLREGEDGQAAITATQLHTAFSEGACGAVAFAWTDEWWRGGHAIDDWAFGLVDTDREPKPALTAVTRAFDDAPFPESQKRSWPRISVVVCAYNEAGTVDECLTALGNLTYPDFEILLVNDGSRDATGEIARRHANVKVIDVVNGGLSAARNIGLEHATGEIVAYTDSDVRVDPDWLTYLVQPFITSSVVGAGGPNIVPPDDPPMAQCIARAPGSPTQVLLDDRIAEHVPGCNMAFRRDALIAVGGFNPIYLRAGDDVDICWRLQARGWKIGFAPAALVWHRHRTTALAYWKQQVGYGEGEAWLKPHHPDRFKGAHIGWRGRIYGPLPFHRALSRPRVNSGTWGTAPFPSVYDTNTYPFAFMPHSARWQVSAVALIGLGLLTPTTAEPWLAATLISVGLAALGITIARYARYALATDIEGLSASGRCPRWLGRLTYRTRIASLYFVQPLARAWGRLRGALSPPQVEMTRSARSPAFALSFSAYRRALPYLTLRSVERRLWGERWVSAETVLTQLAERLQQSRDIDTIEIDDGWRPDRDIRIAVGLWAWLDLRTLVEDHGSGTCLVRIAQRVRPGLLLVLTGLALIVGLLGGVATVAPARWPMLAIGATALAVATTTRMLWLLTRVLMAVDAGIEETTGMADLLQIPDRPSPAPEKPRAPETEAATAWNAAPAAPVPMAQPVTDTIGMTDPPPPPGVADAVVATSGELPSSGTSHANLGVVGEASSFPARREERAMRAYCKRRTTPLGAVRTSDNP